MRNLELLSKYVYDRSSDVVGGWFSDGAAFVTAMIGLHQNAHGISGDIAEIGVFHGKFFILLSLLRDTEEAAFAVDLFDDQHLNIDPGYGLGNKERFLENFSKFDGRTDHLFVMQSDSLALNHERLRRKANVSNIRLFSIDGGHSAGNTFNDLSIADRTLSEDGLVIVDDFYHSHWPGVQEGVHRFLESVTTLVPVAYGENKLFLTRPKQHAFYYGFLNLEIAPVATFTKTSTIHSSPVAYFEQLDHWRDFYRRDFSKSLDVPARYGHAQSDRLLFGAGWSDASDKIGRWMTEDVAWLTLRLPKGGDDQLEIALSAMPYLHHNRGQRLLRLSFNNFHKASKMFSGTDSIKLIFPTSSVGDEILLKLESSQPERLADFSPGSTDQRSLAFCLLNVEIKPAARGANLPRSSEVATSSRSPASRWKRLRNAIRNRAIAF